jgi:hypothetical protein
MRSLSKLTRILPILFILFFACQPEEEQFLENDAEQLEVEHFIADAEERFYNPSAKISDDAISCGDPLEIPLLHHRYFEVGRVMISNTTDALLVNYETVPGITLERTMLVVVIEKKNNINGKKLFDKIKYKKYIYSLNHDPGTTNYLYKLPLSDLKIKSDCISIIAIAKVRDENSTNHRKRMYSFARKAVSERTDRFHAFLIEYCMDDCETEKEPLDDPCEVTCEYGFGIPSVDVGKSYTFEELGITDWPWGYAHEINQETLFRLPVRMDDTENGAVIGQVTVMIEGDVAYVYFQMNDGFPMRKTMLYLSAEEPVSGIPCDYNYVKEYIDSYDTWVPARTDTYIIDNINDIRDSNGKFWIIAYVEFCE